ncbi:MAG TPA: bifunctional aspartate kinase/homoserine dehydrogenase I [Vicinamibacterales bacterium]|nr:bifunctional aspartate kinase/homoserine dehydrogenase I [Vicinamibacterales bacterium]
MKILKFGGSSLATPAAVRAAADIVLDARAEGAVVVVVSAFQGVTNQLIECARLAELGDDGYLAALDVVVRRHRAAVSALVARRRAQVRRDVDAMLDQLASTLQGIHLLRHCPLRALDMTASFGERLSALIVSAHLLKHHPSAFVDSRAFVRTDSQFTNAAVDFAVTNRLARRALGALLRKRGGPIPVVTGFIGSTADGQTTTIGRNGSDYSASIVGAAIGADSVEIWTDVDGVLSADPRIVPAAFVLPQMTYEEAMELSYFGAKVIHSATIAPAVEKRIPIVIRNTFNPSAPGTLISGAKGDPGEALAKGITTVDGLSLLTLSGPGMVGVPGIAERLFRTLAAARVNIILISQASSEHTICFAVRGADAARGIAAIEEEFRHEVDDRLMVVDHKPEQAILAVVGEGMKGRPGVSGKLFDSLGRNNINVNAIAQGASERNISCVIDGGQQVRALNAIHQAFFEARKRLDLVVVGVGNIGGALLRQLKQQRHYLLSRGFDVRVVAVANSRKFALSASGLDLGAWTRALGTSRRKMDPGRLAQAIASLELTNAAVVDCTANPSIVDAYPAFIDANLHVITPNKRANALPWKQYSALMEQMARRQKHFFYEANVGAGLPIMSTLRDLIASGDEILKIEGILSGTLSYLFNTFDGSTPFSALVKEAHRAGFTEPDPRDDLSGQDVARKLLILAREIGLKMELHEVKVDSLVPRALRSMKFSERFFSHLVRYDREIAARVELARGRGAVLRYVGVLERGRARAGLREFPATHPVAAAKGSDNVIAFTTKRYRRTPLVVQGPGAGADVTAMGVFSDILKLLHYLPK